MTKQQIEKETKNKLKDFYTKEEVYNIFNEYTSELYKQNNIHDLLTIIRLEQKFYK